MKPPEILFDLHSGKKSESNPHILEDDFRKMQSRFKNNQQIYTDGSKEDSKVGCAVISDNHSNMQRIPDDSSIFTAEAKAIDLALDFISTCDANNKFIIFSDWLLLEPTSFKILFSNLKPSINKYILEEWQTSWNNSIRNEY